MEREYILGELIDVTDRIWSLMLNLPIEQTQGCRYASPSGVIVAKIDITGMWSGAIYLTIDVQLAQTVARRIFSGLAPDALTDQLVADAVRELANITGGGLKSSLPESSKLGLPEVCAYGQSSDISYKEEKFLELTYESERLPYSVVVVRGNSQIGARGTQDYDSLVEFDR